MTPLMCACEGGHSETALYLISQTSKLDQFNYGYKALEKACQSDIPDVVSCFIERGLNVNSGRV